MSKIIKKVFIGLLAALILGSGSIGWSYAEDDPGDEIPADGDAGFGYTLESHRESHENGYGHGVMEDTDESTYTALRAECGWQDDNRACWYHYSPAIYLFVEDAEYDGKRHGGTLKWKWDDPSAPSTDFHTIKGNSTYPDLALLPGVRVWNTGHDGETLTGERYIEKEAPILPGEYEAEALIAFETLADPDTFQLTSPHYDIKPKELILNWGDDTEFPYDGQAHAPTVEIQADQIVESDVVSVSRTTETTAGSHTAKAKLTGKDSWKYTIAEDSQTKDYIITSPYYVEFRSNAPKNASTKELVTGHMDNQQFEYSESKELTANTYDLPGYEFKGWNTKEDGSGTHYTDKQTVEKLSSGDTFTLYAEWEAKKYKILFRENSDDDAPYHEQWATFDTPGTLEHYSDEAFGWTLPENNALHGWNRTIGSMESFYGDGASYLNICTLGAGGAPQMDDFGNIIGTILIADLVQTEQIVATVTLDGEKQTGLKDCFTLKSDDGTIFNIPTVQNGGKYIFDPRYADPGTGTTPAQLAEGEYELCLNPDEDSQLPAGSARIAYGEGYAASALLDYFTISIAADQAYESHHSVSINGGKPKSGRQNTVVAQDGSKLNIKTTVDEGYQFDGYTATGVEPIWESGDPSKASQSIEVRGRADIMAHIKAAPATEPTISGITNLTGVDALTYGYAENDGQIGVTASAATDTTYKDLTYQWYSCNSDGSSGRVIDTAEEPSAATKDYVIPTGKTAGDYYYYCKVTATRRDNDQTASADSDVATVTVKKQKLTITANDQTYVYNGQIQGEGDTAYEDPAKIAEKVTVSGLQGSDALTSIIIDGQGQNIGKYDLTPSNATLGNAADNYEIVYVNGTLRITPIPLNVTVNGSSTTKTYNGKEQTYEGTVHATSDDTAFDASKFHYNGNTIIKGTNTGDYIIELTKENCTYDDEIYELKCTIGEPIKLTIISQPEPKLYHVVFDTNGGSAVDTQTVKVHEKATKPEDPYRKHYTFAGWYEDKELTIEFDFCKEIIQDTTVYAKWDHIKCNITYDLNGGTLDGKTGKIVVEATEGDVITVLDAPTREGYTFKYWEGSKYYPGDSYTVSENHTLKAVWEKGKSPDPDEPDNPDDPDDNGGVKTGDERNILPWLTLMLLSILSLTVMRIVQRIRHN